MRYGSPTVAERLVRLQAEGCDRILLVPLYPQYAAATTATACDQAFRALMALRWQPAVRVAPPYFDEPAYVDAVATSMREHLDKLNFEPEALLMSFHGMPEKYAEQGDPYPNHCQETARLVRERLGWPEARWHMTYQSQFGSDPWLKPYTIDTMARLARSGVRSLAIVAPGFAADCLETLEELNMENRQVVSRQRRREIRLHPLPQRWPARRGHDREDCEARAGRVALSEWRMANGRIANGRAAAAAARFAIRHSPFAINH